MPGSIGQHRISRGVLIVIGCSVLLGACGSSGKPATTASADPALQFSQCMRAHGVSNFPDPRPGEGFDITRGAGLNPQSPAFQSAQRACQKLLPNKGAPPTMSAAQRQAALRFAQCMRAHGEPDFPDPSQTPPPGTTRILALQGMVFALGPGGIDPKSPAFRQAANACGVRLPGQQSRAPGS